MSGASDYTQTPNLGLYKPIANAAVGLWGDLLNTNADLIDSAMHFSSGGGPYYPMVGGPISGPVTFTAPIVANNYDLTGFLNLHGTTFGINVSSGAPPNQVNYVSAGWHNFVIGAADYVTIDNRTFSVGPPSARSQPEWASGSWGGAGRFVAVDSSGILGLTIKASATATYPCGITGWGIQRASAAGYAAWGVFGRADLYATGGAVNEFNTYNFAGTPSGQLPPDTTFASGDFNTFCLSCFPKGTYDSSLGLFIGQSVGKHFLTGVYLGPSSCTQWQMVLDANATDDLPANGALLIKHRGRVGHPFQITTMAPLVGANPVITSTDSTNTDRFVVTQAGDITTVRDIFLGGFLSFGSTLASSPTDLTKHIELYGSAYGFNVTNTRINYVVPLASGAHSFYSNGVEMATVTSNGLVSPKMFVGSSAGPTWSRGTGVPATTEPKGSMFSRTDGAVGTTLYVSQGGGTWNAVAGV